LATPFSKKAANVATNENYKNAKGEKVTETQWHNVVCWGKLAEIAEKYLEKGIEVAIEANSSTAITRTAECQTLWTCRRMNC
jgi:single-strand DNA-binding protein